MPPVLRVRPSAVFATEGLCRLALTLGLRLERLLEVLGVNACFCPLLPGHLWSLRPVHLYELRLGRASGEGKEARALSYMRTGHLGPRLRLLRFRELRRQAGSRESLAGRFERLTLSHWSVS
jgi:hypothetical protein